MIHRAVILTALQLEHQAVVRHLKDIREDVHEKGTIYEVGLFEGYKATWEVWVAEIGAGNNSAAAEAERIISHSKAEVALFVGVAGGIKDVGLGDVVAATKIYGYESGAEKKEFEARPDVGHSTYLLEQRARAVSRSGKWKDRLGTSDASDEIKSFVGPMAAGEKVLKSKRGPVFGFIKSNYGDALAVEMEGRGFLAAVFANHDVSGIVIRGISDQLSNKEAADAGGSQPKAAANASAFAFEMLANLEGRNPSTDQSLGVSTQTKAAAKSNDVEEKRTADRSLYHELRALLPKGVIQYWNQHGWGTRWSIDMVRPLDAFQEEAAGADSFFHDQEIQTAHESHKAALQSFRAILSKEAVPQGNGMFNLDRDVKYEPSPIKPHQDKYQDILDRVEPAHDEWLSAHEEFTRTAKRRLSI